MQLPLLIFKDLDPEDHFGLKVLKDGFKTDQAFVAYKKDDQHQREDKLTQDSRQYLEDIVQLEEKQMNA